MVPLCRRFHLARMTITQEDLGVSIHCCVEHISEAIRMGNFIRAHPSTDSPEMSGRQADLVGHKVGLNRVIQRVKESQ